MLCARDSNLKEISYADLQETGATEKVTFESAEDLEYDFTLDSKSAQFLETTRFIDL